MKGRARGTVPRIAFRIPLSTCRVSRFAFSYERGNPVTTKAGEGSASSGPTLNFRRIVEGRCIARVSDFGFRVSGFRYQVSGFGFRISGINKLRDIGFHFSFSDGGVSSGCVVSGAVSPRAAVVSGRRNPETSPGFAF